MSITVPPETKIRLKDIDPRHDSGMKKAAAEEEIQAHVAALGPLAYRLYAENKRAVLVVLQGMDTAGKDGVIRKVMEGLNALTTRVSSFKQPSQEELDHDFLWRVHREVPRRGDICIFNRSHYEDVIVVRVHNLVPEPVWRKRYNVINDFERLLTDGGTTVLKFFLHVSKEEQRQRLQARIDDPTKRWKFSRGDLAERRLWDDYQAAYEDALTRCNTEHAPWHIVPADRKWHRDLIVARTLRAALEKLDPQFPPADPGLDGVVVE